MKTEQQQLERFHVANPEPPPQPGDLFLKGQLRYFFGEGLPKRQSIPGGLLRRYRVPRESSLPNLDRTRLERTLLTSF